MLAQIKQRMVALALVTASLAFSTLPGVASAGERDRLYIRKGG